MSLNDVRVVLPIEVVEVFEQFALADDDPRPVHQIFKNAVLDGREVNQHALALHRLLQRIDFQAQSGQRGMGCQLAQVEGLGKVVVGPGVEQLHNGLRALLRRQHQHRRGVLAAAQALQNAQAVELGQHQVEDDEVVAEVLGKLVADQAVLGPIHRETGAVAQGRGQVVGQPHLIFHQQNAHRSPLSPMQG